MALCRAPAGPRLAALWLLLLAGCCLLLWRGRRRPARWAALSICWGENTSQFGKSGYPYEVAAYYASLLWLSQTEGSITPVLTIVTAPGTDAAAPGLRQYVRKLEGAGARVVLAPDTLGDCVLQAQVARMYTWQYSFVEPEDTVILGDADMFLVGRDVLSMLESPARAWLGEYVHTEVGGGTVPMALAAMRAEDWRAGLDFSPTGGPVGMEEVVRHYQSWNGDSDFGKWSIDQVILSFVVLRPDRQLCSLPPSNPLWQRLQLEPRTFDDTGVCYHGNLMNCFIQEHRTHCPWWHFVPSDGEQQFKKVYDDIVEKGAVQLEEGRPFFFNAHLGYTGPPCYALPCPGDPEPGGP